MVEEFAERSSMQGGGPGAAALGTVASEALYTVFSGAMQLLPPTIIGTYLTVINTVKQVTSCSIFYAALGNATIPETICDTP